METMKNTIQTHSFFIEIILVLFFLAVSSVAVLQIFFAANSTVTRNTETQYAMTAAQTAAETLYAMKTPQDLESSFGSGQQTKDGTVFLSRFDKNWQPVSSGGAYYTEKRISVSTEQAGTLLTLDVSVYSQASSKHQELFSLTSQRYFPSWSEKKEGSQ